MKITVLHPLIPVLALLGLGCSSINPTVETQIPETGPWSALAVLPMMLISGDTGFNTHKRTHDVLRTLWNESEWAVVEPAEFNYRDPTNRDFFQSTDLVVRAQSWGLDPRNLAVLQGAVSIREANSKAQSGAGSSATYQGEAAISLQMFTMKGARVAEVNVEVPLDPFAPHPDYDRRPEIATAIEECVRTLLDACPDCVRTVSRPELPLLPNPVPLLQTVNSDRASLAQTLERADPVTRDSMLLNHLEYMVHNISLSQAQFLATKPKGVCLAEASPPLQQHECILGVNDIPVSSPHGLARALHGKEAARLTVKSADGMERRVVYNPDS